MDTKYDQKFEEMKKYIPFLESMIKRLESTSGGPGSANPRQAQLDKIRSLRDLLLDKKKRMKMENLLKCEQVLVNLYAKVEQPDTMPGIKPLSEVFPSSSSKSSSDLHAVRNKLKTVTLKSIKEAETLPEIARRSETEESCTPGSKEPALFQRRPNKIQSSSQPCSVQSTVTISSQKSGSKHNYARLLLTPNTNPQQSWYIGEGDMQKPLYSRRSPRRSPKRHSPSYKGGRKRSSKQSKVTKDLNITLNVPQDSLDSLNTDDILSRIINCDDNDVDIATLRDLRTQILGELKQTGASEDISDIIMKSYKTKKKNTVMIARKKDDFEEGELSDSESEAIESIYGSLVVFDKDKATAVPSGAKESTDNENKSRKIQICLVINSDKDDKGQEVSKVTDVSEFEMFDDVDIAKPTEEDKQKETMTQTQRAEDVQNKLERLNVCQKEKSQEVITIDDDDESKKSVLTLKNTGNAEKPKIAEKEADKNCGRNFIDLSSTSEPENSSDQNKERSIKGFKANFYKPLHDNEITESSKVSDKNKSKPATEIKPLELTSVSGNKEAVYDKNKSKPTTEIKPLELTSVSENKDSGGEKTDSSSSAKPVIQTSADIPVSEDFTKDVEIPLLNTDPVVPAAPTKNVLSEIDILQALKNEILSESLAIPGAEGSTPLLHQPKLVKVASAQEVINKKRISIEKYKQKSNSTSTSSLFSHEPNVSISRYDHGKKQSLKLTEEECERFNFPIKLAIDDSSDEADNDDYSIDNIYADLAPKSPENDNVSLAGSLNPIIIPGDPVKPTVVNSKIDIDMRTLMPILSPNSGRALPVPPPPPLMSLVLPVPPSVEMNPEQNKRPLLLDPRVRRDFNKSANNESPNPYTTNSERSRPTNYANITPSRAPSMTPNARTYEITPSHQSIDLEDNSSRKHVYAPLLTFQSRERERSVVQEISTPSWETNYESANEGRKSRWEETEERDGNNLRSNREDHERRSIRWEDNDRRGSSTRDVTDYQKSRYDHPDRYQQSRSDRYSNDQRDDFDYYNRQECPRTPIHPFGRLDCPTTPNPSFGRHESPITPIHTFGRSECPSTPSHPFGRPENPQTPSHPFGRSECPSTPNPSFGRHEVPITPIHPFGRSECPLTPSHPFGRSDVPLTPSHPFGRNDMNMAPMPSSHPFGRSDYPQSQPVQKSKDPRLNRSTDFQRHDDDKDRDYYRNRKKTDHSNRFLHDASVSYHDYNHEQRVGRNDRNKHYEQKKQNRERTPHRDLSVGSNLSRDGDRFYIRRDTGSKSANDSSLENFHDSRMDCQRASSVGRTHPSVDRYHRSSRAPSIGKNDHDTNNDNKLSVKPQSGRSFTIDTSVNRTFQEFLKEKGLHLQVIDHSFEARRQRATSVGRTLPREPSVGRSRRESSVGRTMPPIATTHDSLDYKTMVNFVRARSMCRDLGDRKQEKTLNEIKADFQSYSASYNKREQDRKRYQKINTQSSRSRKDLHEMTKKRQQSSSSSSKATYSPRKNQREPRMKREQQNYETKNSYRNRHENKKNAYGIVYSSDNIAKGTILGSGYGVKNYKIPKIKRPVEDIKKEETKVIQQKDKGTAEKSKVSEKNKNEQTKFVDKKNKGEDKKLKEPVITSKIKCKEKVSEIIEGEKKEKNKDMDDKNTDNKVKVSDDDIKRVTRSNKKDDVGFKALDEISVPKTRRVKRAVIESDSDSDLNERNKVNNDLSRAGKPNDSDDLLNSSFGIDDLEIFPGNNGVTDVMANINDLIADLDNELENNKSAEESNQFTQELSLENMLESINSSEAENLKKESVEESLQDISELINKDLKHVHVKPVALNEQNVELSPQTVADLPPSKTIDVPNVNIAQIEEPKINEALPVVLKIIPETKIITPAIVAVLDGVKEDSSNDMNKVNNEAIVSTTNKESKQKNYHELEVKIDDRSSTPDSTINTSEIGQNKSCEESLPDSTNEMQAEMNSDITSTHDTASKDALEPNSSNKESIPPLDSIGNLLSILQNKSKIKELLSMLGGKSSDNDKIKKKLEKLSELVSDEEDTNDSVNEPEETPYQKEMSVVIENKEPQDKPELPTDSSEVLVEAYEKDSRETRDIEQIEPTSEEKDTKERVETMTEKVVKGRTGKKARKSKLKAEKKIMSTKAKRITRSGAALKAGKPKASRELRQLQNDIKEMFISEDILNASGIRMCRLAKLVDEKQQNQDGENTVASETKPVVVLQKFKEKDLRDDKIAKIRKKSGPKPKLKVPVVENLFDAQNKTEMIKTPPARRMPGPKSKTKISQDDSDPYAFESDSVSDITTPQPSEDMRNSSDSENESLASSKSFESTEALADFKKKKRKRRSGWSSGVITKRKKKIECKQKELEDEISPEMLLQKKVNYPDMSCFVDKTYCFYRAITTYPCRLCEYSGDDIVHHYKKQHPHTEIPLSRMSAIVAREAIEQCEDVDFNAISKLPSEKYTCRFCFKEISGKRALLETFFWHVVSMHTGEYKQLCPECVNVVPCPFNLDIPPPPKDTKGQLIGYICGKCNFTQISLENLKIHVIVRHNDEQTEVCTINLAIMTKKSLAALVKRQSNLSEPRVLRSRTNQSVTETSDDRSDDHSELIDSSYQIAESKKDLDSDIQDRSTSKIPVHSKLTFESDDATDLLSENTVKIKTEYNQEETFDDSHSGCEDHAPVSDILDCPHFKISFKNAGAKEYICCINGNDNHYKTSLLISLKKHIQTKHSENWDGYCFICKVIVMPQGKHTFRDCLQHMLDKHIDSFPVLQNMETSSEIVNVSTQEAQVKTSSFSDKSTVQEQTSMKPYINVRPLSDLMFKEIEIHTAEGDSDALPKIQSVMSLGAPCAEPPTPSPTPPVENAMQDTPPKLQEPVRYEEAQAEIMSKKHRIVLDAMLVPEKLIQIFKCAGRFCSFTTDSAEAALLHASTHQRIGGENALMCAYCDTDSKGNGIDLITHVFKSHGYCQYSCGHCFYRAAASQLVRAHMIRVHGVQHAQCVVYQNSVAVTTNEDKAGLLPRNLAVEYYTCAAAGCKFKTFIHGKFSEHLMKHGPPYSCHICLSCFASPVVLVQHLKTHGLMLYQCTWCVYGAENEAELLAHASVKHPSKIPQAYLRVITQKDGNTSKMMVLPLAQLNKSSVQVKVLISPNKTDDPSREAERSIDLEKLIGSVIKTMDTTVTLTAVPDNDPAIECMPPFATDSETMEHIPPEPISTNESEMATLIPEPSRVVGTPVPVPPTAEPLSEGQNVTQPLIPVCKTEPMDETPTKDKPSSADVICLDSEEEDSGDTARNVISVSDDDTSTSKEKQNLEGSYKKFSASDLYKCPGCMALYKSSPAFKRHVMSCLCKLDKYNCAHCPKVVYDLDGLLKHYNLDHGACPKLRSKNTKDPRAQNYVCGICNRKDSSLYFIKSHLKNFHGITNVIVASKHSDTGGFLYTVREDPGSKPKRKLSAGSATEQTPPKRKRYSPQHLNKLPTRPIFDEPAYCSECEFSTKVLSNLVRHLQQHADAQAVPSTVPVNPVPHLETNEKHFDKMINLASSSLVNKSDKPSRSDNTPSVTLLIPPEAAARYPKYVPERQRYTCGTRDCSYTSVDEAMLKCHWETLHAGSNNFHCVHCPPYQHLDTSKPLTAGRIIAHLKMHDVRLYACSSCAYYHYRRQVVEKHLAENHKGSGQVLVVREEATNQAPPGPVQLTPVAPTMDLKPWQCGLCKYKNMLRQEVIEHCSKVHNSKWQFKCPNCPFRGSTLENVSNHQSRVHTESRDDVFYYYYREGSLPQEPDGIPRWQQQRQKMNPESDVKTESETETPTPAPKPTTSALVTTLTSVTVDLNIVKKEVVDPEIEDSMEHLYKRFGPSCNPNGLKYKCPLCKVVMEESKDAMQSHLYEELQYRKWGCSICSYKAFHKTGLNEHMSIEHRFRQVSRNDEVIELPINVNIEKWVTNILERQTDMIEKNRENLLKQKIQVTKTDVAPITSATTIKTNQTSNIFTIEAKEIENLSRAFGIFGSPKNMDFCCPKCGLQTRDENEMKNHLELELNKIRWRCSSCSDYSQNYHEAQLHCKTCKNLRPGQSARPIEAVRDPCMRASWVSAVVHVQKQTMKQPEDSSRSTATDGQSNPFGTIENSLLTVRYEEKVPTPEEVMLLKKKNTPSTSTAPSTATSPDSDDERLVIDEPTDEVESPPKKKLHVQKKCKYCDFVTKYSQVMYTHTLRHYNLMPYICEYCGFSCHKSSMVNHFANFHPGEPEKFTKTLIPTGPPVILKLAIKRYRIPCNFQSAEKETERTENIPKKEDLKPKEDVCKSVCLVCEKVVSEAEKSSHFHDKIAVTYAKRGDVVVKCCICLALLLDGNAMQEHHTTNHPNTSINYAYFKLNHDTREIHYCGHCNKGFKFIRDLRTHHTTLHPSLPFKYESKPYTPGSRDLLENEQEGTSCVKKKNDDDSIHPLKKRVARKSTTKLPNKTVARKSTTKLPFEDELLSQEFSFYGTKPTPMEQLDEVNLLMSFSNTKMPMTLRKLSDVMNVDPKVIIKDCKK